MEQAVESLVAELDSEDESTPLGRRGRGANGSVDELHDTQTPETEPDTDQDVNATVLDEGLDSTLGVPPFLPRTSSHSAAPVLRHAGSVDCVYDMDKQGPHDEKNPTPQAIPPPSHVDTGVIGELHVLVMVGLPARGKTHMARKLMQYLSFFHGAVVRLFNVGNYRRNMLGPSHTNDFFDPKNAENDKLRQECAHEAMRDMISFLFQKGGDANGHTLEQKSEDSGRIGIYDATNTTKARRKWITEMLRGLPVKLIFIESVCTDEEIIKKNIWDAKVNLPDYARMGKQEAYNDFKRRIAHYESVYEPMDEDELSWIKLINTGRRIEINNVHGFLPIRMLQFLTNIHATRRSIYLSRHGQSEYNAQNKIGGDSNITEQGRAYARKLADYAEECICQDEEGKPVAARLWTSSLKRTMQTAAYIRHPKLKLKHGGEWIQMSQRVYRNLDELYAGVCDGMTYKEIEEQYPEEYRRRKEDKLFYRYPRGESYLDVISRLDPLVHEIESYREPLLIVGHQVCRGKQRPWLLATSHTIVVQFVQAVLRLIYAYFTGVDRDKASRLSIPLNTVIKLTPRTYECVEERIELQPEDYSGSAEPPSH